MIIQDVPFCMEASVVDGRVCRGWVCERKLRFGFGGDEDDGGVEDGKEEGGCNGVRKESWVPGEEVWCGEV